MWIRNEQIIDYNGAFHSSLYSGELKRVRSLWPGRGYETTRTAWTFRVPFHRCDTIRCKLIFYYSSRPTAGICLEIRFWLFGIQALRVPHDWLCIYVSFSIIAVSTWTWVCLGCRTSRLDRQVGLILPVKSPLIKGR